MKTIKTSTLPQDVVAMMNFGLTCKTACNVRMTSVKRSDHTVIVFRSNDKALELITGRVFRTGRFVTAVVAVPPKFFKSGEAILQLSNDNWSCINAEESEHTTAALGILINNFFNVNRAITSATMTFTNHSTTPGMDRLSKFKARFERERGGKYVNCFVS